MLLARDRAEADGRGRTLRARAPRAPRGRAAAAGPAEIANAGAVFLGPGSAEVFGDYGAGPNHCLPTGGAARFAAGLSVLAFLRARTWLEMDDGLIASEAAALARIEGLEAHARAAELRAAR